MEYKLSIVIPTYNESHNIVPLINKIFETVARDTSENGSAEIIVIDDNSPDGTGQLCQPLGDKYPSLKVITRTNERGLGSAIKRGILESNGDSIVIMDADFSHDYNLIPGLAEEINNNSTDIAVASRFTLGGKMISSRHCVIGSKILNTFIRTLLRIPVKDMTGGFIAVRRKALEGLDLDTIFIGYGDYCITLLYKGFKKGWRIKEIAFTYHRRQDDLSKTKFFSAGLSYGIRTLKLRLGLK